MASFAGIAKGIGNVATGGILNALTKKPGETPEDPNADLANMKTDDLKKIAAYDPGVLGRLGNLLTGGILGEATGMNSKMDRAGSAADMIREEEMNKRLMDRMRRLIAAQSPQPFTSPESMQTGAFQQNNMAPVSQNMF